MPEPLRFRYPPLLWLALVLLLTACSKSDDPLTSTQLLSRTWQIQTLTGSSGNLTQTYYTKGGTQNDEDLSMYRFAFESDGTYRFTTDQGTVWGTWELTEQATRLLLDGTDSFTVETLTESAFHFSYDYEDTDSAGQVITIRVTYQLIPIT